MPTTNLTHSMFGIVLVVLAMVAFVAFWAQWRIHQERADAGPWWRAWGTRATVATIFSPARLTPEGRRWRVIALGAWLVFIAIIILASFLGE
jgi:hypothetical protein